MRPNNQVVHVSEDAHAALMDYCKRNNLRAKDFVSGLIANEVKRAREQPRNVLVFSRPDEG